MNAPSIDAIVVDLGGVAARFRPERRLHALASATGIDPHVIHERLFSSGFDRRCELGELTAEEAMSDVLSALNAIAVADLVEAWSLAFEPNAAIVDREREASVRRVLFTNNGPLLDACLAGPLRALADAFDDVICSWQLRAAKPDPLAFERAAARLGMPARSLLLLDDSPANVLAAREVGWNAALVEEYGDVERALARFVLR